VGSNLQQAQPKKPKEDSLTQKNGLVEREGKGGERELVILVGESILQKQKTPQKTKHQGE